MLFGVGMFAGGTVFGIAATLLVLWGVVLFLTQDLATDD